MHPKMLETNLNQWIGQNCLMRVNHLLPTFFGLFHLHHFPFLVVDSFEIIHDQTPAFFQHQIYLIFYLVSDQRLWNQWKKRTKIQWFNKIMVTMNSLKFKLTHVFVCIEWQMTNAVIWCTIFMTVTCKCIIQNININLIN